MFPSGELSVEILSSRGAMTSVRVPPCYFDGSGLVGSRWYILMVWPSLCFLRACSKGSVGRLVLSSIVALVSCSEGIFLASTVRVFAVSNTFSSP